MNLKTIRSMSGVHLLSVAFIGVALSVPAIANSGTSTPSTPSRGAYIEPPQQSYTVYSGGSLYPYSGSSSSYYRGGTYWGNTYGYSTTYAPRRYFFPPYPPALGEPFAKNRTKSASLVRSQIPIQLSEFINEPFYSPIATLLHEEDGLPKRRQKVVDDYMAAKSALVSELRGKIESLKNADASQMEAEFARFAQEQAPRAAAVERQGYAVRDELTDSSFFFSAPDWNEGRMWRLGDNTRYESTMDEAKAARGTAFYQDGLTPAQRRLLREVAMELDDSGRGISTEIALDARGPYLYFSPEMSRIRLPADMPPDLQAKINEYTQLKNSLKRELRDVLYREDRRFWDSKRAAAFRSLGAKQESQFARVDALAEEIRRGLSKLPNPAKPAAIAKVLPAAISDKVNTYLAQRTEYLKVMNEKSNDLRRQFRSSRVEFVRMGQGYGIQVVANRKLSDEDKARVAEAQAQLVGFNQQQVAVYSSLANQKESIRQAVVQSAGTVGPMLSQRIIDMMLADYTNTVAVQELWNQYREYEIAVLQPGLSPEQRRLLFDAALVKMDLQLPYFTY